MFADTHCHLCPHLDDGPRSYDQALDMCRIAWNEGTRMVAAVAHQNETWQENTPDRILTAARELQRQLAELDCPLQLVPTGEVMISPTTLEDWQTGRLLSLGNQGKYLLIEYPHNTFLDIRELVSDLVAAGVRPIIAHAERQAELLHDDRMTIDLIRRGGLIQVSTAGLTEEPGSDWKRVRRWAQRGFIHIVCSDGHSTRRRPPHMLSAFTTLKKWVGSRTAQRIFWDQGRTVLIGRALQVTLPKPRGAVFRCFGVSMFPSSRR